MSDAARHMPQTMLQAALAHAAQGKAVFPCNPLDKRPLTKNGHKDASTDPAQITRWWQRWPNAMIGMPMGTASEMFCVDLDLKNDIDGRETWKAWQQEWRSDLALARMHATPSGGEHVLFQWQEGIRNIPLGKLGPGIEVKAEGGYIIVPPSVMADGKEYTVINDSAPTPAPQPLLDRMWAYWRRDSGPAPEADTEADVDEIKLDPEILRMLPEDMGKGIHYEDRYGDGPPDDEDIRDAVQVLITGLPSEDYEGWYKIGASIFKAAGNNGYTYFRDWSATSKKFNEKECQRKWKQVQSITSINAASIFWHADQVDPEWRHRSEQKRWDHQEARREQQARQQQGQHQEKKADGKPRRLNLLNTTGWDSKPAEEPEYEVANRIPTKQVTLFSGEGGAGKSILCMQLMVATVLQRPWLGTTPRQGPALFIEAEDGESIIHYRMQKLLQHYDSSFDAVRAQLHLVTMHGRDTVLGTFDRRLSRMAPTALYDELLEMAGDIKPRIIAIASSANVFAGSEIDRVQVQQFIGLLTRITLRSGGGLILISHPSLTGINTGSGLSGSTQWHNAVRARMVMTGDQKTSLRQLEFHKNQYGPVTESIPLGWNDGMFERMESTAYADASKFEQVKNIFMTILLRYRKHKMRVTANPAPGYAPKKFADEQEAVDAKLTKVDLARAMSALLEEGRISNSSYRKDGHKYEELVIVGEQEEMQHAPDTTE